VQMIQQEVTQIRELLASVRSLVTTLF
jgi:hypothetical protein